jgi:glycosyltransferase involved in cell wall biosynthesis
MELTMRARIIRSLINRIRRLAGTRAGEFILDRVSCIRQLYHGTDPCGGYPFETIKLLKPIKVRLEAVTYPQDKALPYTLITPVKNEEDGIEAFMRSIEQQTLIPAEAILVDGGSTDSTVAIMKRYAKKSNIRFTILAIKSRSISEQRNLGAKRAKTGVIVFADAGCVLDKNYGVNLSGSLAAHPRAGLAGGIFFATPRTLAPRFEFSWESLARWNTYLPAGKCMALRRDIFLKAGGFPEHLPYSGEDYLFDVTIRRFCREWVINQNAFVTWEIPSSMTAAKKKYRSYGKGDGQNGLGDYIHFRQMREFMRTKKVTHDELGTELFKGYLEGRKERAGIEIERRGIKAVVILFADGLLTSAPHRQEKISYIRELTGQNIKVIYVAQGKLRPARPRFVDADMSLVELYSEKSFSPEEITHRYASFKGKIFTCSLSKKEGACSEQLRKKIPGIEMFSLNKK